MASFKIKFQDGDRKIFSKKSFKTGSTIYQEHPLLVCCSSKSLCHSCLLPVQTSLCGGCRVVRYCSSSCQSKDWPFHKLLCHWYTSRKDQSKTFSKVSCLKAVPELLQLLSKLLCLLKQKQISLKDSDFYTLKSNRELSANTALESQLAQLLIENRDFITYLKSHFHFTAEDLLQILFRLACNAVGISNQDLQYVAVGLYLQASLVNHSCHPNAIFLFEGNVLILKALKNIFSGEEIVVAYIDVMQDKHTRQKELQERYLFVCECEKCRDGSTGAEAEHRCPCCLSLVYDQSGIANHSCKGELKQIVEKENLCFYFSCIKACCDKLPFLKDRSEQLKLIEKLIHFYLEISSDLNVHVAAYLNRAMDLCIELQLYRKAITYGERALPAMEVHYSELHPLYALQLYKIGKLHCNEFQLKEALTLLEKAWNILKFYYSFNSSLMIDLKDHIQNVSIKISLDSSTL